MEEEEKEVGWGKEGGIRQGEKSEKSEGKN